METRKVYCEIVEGVTYETRCLFKLSKIIEGNETCENCILRQLERMKKAGRSCANDISNSKDIKDIKDIKGVKKKSRRAKARRGRKPGAITVAPPDPGQTYTVQDLSQLLGKPKRRIQELAQKGKIPGHKVGRHWKFPKEEIDKWLSEKRAMSLHCNHNVMITTEASPGQNPCPPDQNDEGSPNHGG